MQTITHLLEELESMPNELINAQFPLLEKFIDQEFIKIKLSEKLEDANVNFNILQNIQEALSNILFNKKIELSPKLRTFVRDFERLDDVWLREFMFEKIKNDQ